MAIPQRRSQRVASSGNCSIGVTRDEVLDDRMAAALTFSDTAGTYHVVDLTLSDVRNMFGDLVRLLGANQQQVDTWWQRLADGRDGRPQAAVPR